MALQREVYELDGRSLQRNMQDAIKLFREEQEKDPHTIRIRPEDYVFLPSRDRQFEGCVVKEGTRVGANKVWVEG